jgi:serine/threonine protein kinase
MLQVGQVLNNRYRVAQWIADGGQSTVYLATDERTFNRQVVVKEFKLGVGASADAETARHQFEASARMLSQLSHPGIVHVIDYFFTDNTPILVTEYVKGETLEERVTLAPMGLPEKQVIGMADQLCDVLGYLHNQMPPVIYRDLTPGNIILTTGDKVKLIDFGIARTFKEGKASDTEPLGTAGYAPPEQHGKSQTGPYSDVYSLGATLLRAATGYDPSLTPFMLPRADRVNGDLKTVSPALSDAIEKATQVDIRKRYQSVGEFRKAVHRSESIRGMARGASIGLVVVVVLVGMLLCSGIGLMLGSAFGAFNPTTATPGASAAVAAILTTATSKPTQAPSPSPAPTATDTPAPSPTTLAGPTITSSLSISDAAALASPLPAPSTLSTPVIPAPPVTPTTPAESATPSSTPTSTPTQTPTPTSIPTATPDPTSTPVPTPSATPIQIDEPTKGTGDLPEPHIAGVGIIHIPGNVSRDRSFEVTVYANNNGGAPANGGSITLSFSQAAEVKITDADNNNIINIDPFDCQYGDSYARVITPDGQCRSVMSYQNTDCQTFIDASQPIAESYYADWEGGTRHYLTVRVKPREDADIVAIYIRASMRSNKAGAQACDILNAPLASEANGVDQQGFPVRTINVVVSKSMP